MTAQNRYKLFRRQLGPKLKSDVEELLKDARKTLANLAMVEAIDQQEASPSTAVSAINSSIQMLPHGKLEVTDIDPHVWSFCQRVVRGEVLITS